MITFEMTIELLPLITWERTNAIFLFLGPKVFTTRALRSVIIVSL